MHFHELVADPLATIAKAYERLGLPWTNAAAEGAIRACAAAHPRGRLGEHRYRLADWGLAREAVHETFRFYTERCGVALEDSEWRMSSREKVLSGQAWAEFCARSKRSASWCSIRARRPIRSTAPRATAS